MSNALHGVILMFEFVKKLVPTEAVARVGFETHVASAREAFAARDMAGSVMDIAIAILFAAIVLGYVALPIFFTTNTTGWGATNILIWGVIPTLSIAGILIIVIQHIRKGGAA